MPKMRSFRDDEGLEKRLDAIPKYERSTIIRMALRDWFKEVELKKLPPGRVKPMDHLEAVYERGEGHIE